jgi:hypothetical protein
MKECFNCKRNLPLSEFNKSNRKYQLKSDLGVVKVCKICNFQKAIKTLSLVNFNFELNKFEVINFESINEVSKWFVNNNKI